MSREDFTFRRGEYVRDRITGFSGIVISRVDSITGCDRYCVQPTELDQGKMIPAEWFDVHCLELDPENANKKFDLYVRTDEPPG